MGSTVWKALIPVLVGIIIAVLPVPQGLEPKAWYFFACFTAVIVGLSPGADSVGRDRVHRHCTGRSARTGRAQTRVIPSNGH